MTLVVWIASIAMTAATPAKTMDQDSAHQARNAPLVAENAAYRLELASVGDAIVARLTDKADNLTIADGPLVYRARSAAGDAALQDATVSRWPDGLAVKGRLAGLEVEHTFALPADRPMLEERVVVTNRTDQTSTLLEVEIGFTRAVARGGQTTSTDDIENDRWVAVPLRHRATDPTGYFHEFTTAELLTKPGWEPFMDGGQGYRQIPSRHHVSEGWAWLHGEHALGIFKFSQACMQFSVLSPLDEHTLRFGGACTVSGEPAALGRLKPGEALDLGVTRYETVRGGYEQAEYAFRRMLDEHGCRFPKDFDPPVHWEQLYDMEGAWDNRATRYTKAIVEKEAEKGRAYSCEALYLDPGWDTTFASFKWGEHWLGPRKQFVEEMRSKYGLAVSLHTPLATWMSTPGLPMGPFDAAGWPQAARRIAPVPAGLSVPAEHGGRRNLALLPEAKASASSVFEGGKMAIHQITHLNDGWYGNSASWIAGEMPCWAQIDLGAEYRISEVVIGNEHFGAYRDRVPTVLRILVGKSEAELNAVAALDGAPLTTTRSFEFPPVAARLVRIEITSAEQGLPRLDEIEVYAAAPDAGEFVPRRGPQPPIQGGAQLCLGAKQYLDEAEQRLLANCADGVVFLMFDGNWWNGGCENPNHGHPVPYTWEDHMRANLELAQRVHAQYPKVLIEMHDMLAGGSPARPTPVYYKYGLPGSFDDNWGFELMWDPMADLRAGRGASLYYYNLGCNIPMYLHIDLRKDNRECVVLWWYASTCRHLGIGGTHADPAVVAAQQAAMRWYHAHEEFYKRGDFYGPSEEVHVHVLPARQAFVVNLFNLSNEERTITGTIDLRQMGLDPAAQYTGTESWGSCAGGEFRATLKMPPWSARVAAYQVGTAGAGKAD